MADLLIDLEIDEIFDIGGMPSDAIPVIRDPVNSGAMADVSDILDDFVLVPTTTVIDRRYVINLGTMTVLSEIDDLIESISGTTTPVIRNAVNAGNLANIPIGTRPPWPGDTLHLIDFEEEFGRDLEPTSDISVVLIKIGDSNGVILGNFADAELGFSSLSSIEFMKNGLYVDLVG